MSRICKWLLVAFLMLYVTALALLVIGVFGLFGAQRDPLAGVFLIPLGLPWNRLIGGLPESVLPWVAVGCPLVNVLVLMAACRAGKSGSTRE